MKLPIPILVGDVLYTDCEITSPTVNIIIETRKIIEEGVYFSAMKKFCAGCISEIKTEEGKIITDSISIKSILAHCCYRTIEYIAIQAMLKHYSDDDGIEGIYYCPRCGVESIAELKEEDGMTIDTRDHINELAINYFDSSIDSFLIHVDLSESVKIYDKKNNELLLEVADIDVLIPTLEQSIQAEAKVGSRDSIRLQLAIYVEALKKVNGKEIDTKFKNIYGSEIFGNITNIKKDLGFLSDSINKFGMARTVKKTCKRCGKIWASVVNTSNFFVSTPLV